MSRNQLREVVISPADPITLSTMEPVATAGLAVTLAYLALDRFRYRREIEDAAGACHALFCNDPQIGGQTELGVWNEVLWLTRRPCNRFKPAGFWGGLYKRVFRKHLDFYIISFLAIASGFALAVGVAHRLQTWSWLTWADTRAGAIAMFYLCVLATAFPLLSMYGGHRCRGWGVERSRFCQGQLKLFLGERVEHVESPIVKGEPPAPDEDPTIAEGERVTPDRDPSAD